MTGLTPEEIQGAGFTDHYINEHGIVQIGNSLVYQYIIGLTNAVRFDYQAMALQCVDVLKTTRSYVGVPYNAIIDCPINTSYQGQLDLLEITTLPLDGNAFNVHTTSVVYRGRIVANDLNDISAIDIVKGKLYANYGSNLLLPNYCINCRLFPHAVGCVYKSNAVSETRDLGESYINRANVTLSVHYGVPVRSINAVISEVYVRDDLHLRRVFAQPYYGWYSFNDLFYHFIATQILFRFWAINRLREIYHILSLS